MNQKTIYTFVMAFATAALLVGATVATWGPAASATHQPADKLAVAGSGLEILTSEVTEGGDSVEATILSGTLKISEPTDLIISVTAECALWTDIVTVGNDQSESVASVKIWVEIDGEPVAVAGDDTEETGEVVFCNRAFKRETLEFDDEDATIKTFLRTRQANAFNWISINPSDLFDGNVHTVEVKAQLDAEVTGAGMAKAGIGKRTLVIEPVKLANDVTI